MYRLLWILFISTFSNGMTINKCCRQDEIFNNQFDRKCINFKTSGIEESIRQLNHENFTIISDKRPCSDTMKVVSLSEVTFISNGDLIVKETIISDINISYNTTYSKDNFCVEKDKNDIKIYLCPCENHLCINKCCPKYRHFKWINNDVGVDCVKVQPNSNLTEWHPDVLQGKIEVYNEVYNLNIECGDDEFKILTGELYLNPDGSIHSEKDGTVQPHKYCGDYKINNMERKVIIKACIKRRHWLLTVLVIIGALLLSITALVNYWSRKASWMLSRMYTSQMSTQAVAFIMIAISKMNTLYMDKPSLCIFIGYTMQFSFMASFFWLNSICIDMSLTFSSIKSSSSNKKNMLKKFLLYSLYSWGVPFFITLSSLAVDFLVLKHNNSYQQTDRRFGPKVGEIRCLFRESGTLWVFFYGPVGIILIINLILFLYITYCIYNLKKDNKHLHKEGSVIHAGKIIHKEKKRFSIFAKLFFLMGITWLTDVVSWIVGEPYNIWYFTDAVNLLGAVLIFVMFCCKKNIWNAICKKWISLKIFKRIFGKLCIFSFNEDFDSSKRENSISTVAVISMQNIQVN